jgi:hypothetical protein
MIMYTFCEQVGGSGNGMAAKDEDGISDGR